MSLSENTCKFCLLVVCLGLLSLQAQAKDFLKELTFNWQFDPTAKWVYRIKQVSHNQKSILDQNDAVIARSPIRIESLHGEYTIKSLSDGNAAGDLVLELEGITENDASVPIPEAQKIPQRVARFRLTQNGAIEDYIGPKKETYLITRLILGLPAEPLQIQQVRVYPFQLFTRGDTVRTRFTGTISHELAAIESCNDAHCAKIVTTIDIRDVSPDMDPVIVTWKGVGTSIFNIDKQRLETMSMELAVKTQFPKNKENNRNLLVEIYTIELQFFDK